MANVNRELKCARNASAFIYSVHPVCYVCVCVYTQACVFAFCANFRMHNLMRRQVKLAPGTICQVFRWGNINTRICSHVSSFRLPAEEE